MSDPAPLPRLKRDWVGRKVRNKHELRNGNVSIPAGSILTVEQNRGARQMGGGLVLRSPECPCCKVRVFITRVLESDVELLPLEQP